MTRIVSLAAGTILDVTPESAVRVAEESGFPAVGIWFDAETWTPQRTRAVADAVRDSPVIALDIEPIMLTPEGDHGDAIVDAALEIGAQNILVASRETDVSRVGNRLSELAQRLDGSPIRLVLEFLPILGIRTLPEALGAVRFAASEKVGVLIDSLHLARASHTPLDLIGLDRSLFPYLQLCDAPLELSDLSMKSRLHEALHGRLLPGDGGLPLYELLDSIPSVPISLELRSEHLRTTYPDPVERARVLFDATSRFLEGAPEPFVQ
jgi:sugar phosphate isomerase/epimerase